MRAQGLMEKSTGLRSRSEFHLLSLMTKQSLKRTLENDASKSNCVTTAALIYLAALYFASSEYQQAIHLCSAVLSDLTQQEEMETLNACCLLFINNVTKIIGLCALRKKIVEISLHCIGRRLHVYVDLRLSPEMFAHYLAVLSSEKTSRPTRVARCPVFNRTVRYFWQFVRYKNEGNTGQCMCLVF